MCPSFLTDLHNMKRFASECLFFSPAWCDELTSSIIHQKKEGTVFRVQLKVSSSETTKFFCRRECEGAAVLITTAGDRAQSGRFSIEYKNSSSAAGVLSVTITHLNKSDTDRYRFGLGTPLAPRVSKDFQIKVLDGENHKTSFYVQVFLLHVKSREINSSSSQQHRKKNSTFIRVMRDRTSLFYATFLPPKAKRFSARNPVREERFSSIRPVTELTMEGTA